MSTKKTPTKTKLWQGFSWGDPTYFTISFSFFNGRILTLTLAGFAGMFIVSPGLKLVAKMVRQCAAKWSAALQTFPSSFSFSLALTSTDSSCFSILARMSGG